MVKILLGFGIGGLAVWLVPRLLGDDSAVVPSISVLLGTALIVGLATTLALYLVVTRRLGLGRTVALLAVAYNLLLVVVKFVLAPRGFYEVNQTRELTQAIPMSTGAGAVLTAALILLLYVAVYSVIFLVLRSRVGEQPGRRRRANGLLIALLVICVVAAASGFAVAGVIALGNAADYLGFVFGSSMSLLVVVFVAVAATLAGAMFANAADRAKAVGDAAVLVNLFWAGLAFLALYHVLWVVYILALTTIWPLKVVTPK
jgi:hypothetical protein